jgi:DNA-binding transcriptional LysR family regulator
VHLRTLDRAIGQRLVIRNGRGSKLTAAGQIVASHAAKVLANLDGMRWAVDAVTEPSRCELTPAASCTASLVLIPPILRDFSERHPGVSMRIRTLPSQMVVREVARAAADVGIAGDVASTETVVRRQILIDELVGIASPGLLSPDGGSVSRAEFARNNLLLGAEGSSTRMIAERNLASVDSGVAGVRSARFAISVRRIVSEHIVA